MEIHSAGGGRALPSDAFEASPSDPGRIILALPRLCASQSAFVLGCREWFM